MSNTKVLNFSSSTTMSSSKTGAFKSSFDAAKLMKVPPHKLPSTATTKTTTTTTPRMSRRKACENSNKSSISAGANNFSPLRSPQLIRTKNWINSTSTTSSNNNKVSSSGGSSTCSDESIIPKYESTTATSQKRAYNFNRVTTTRKVLNSARNTAMLFEQHQQQRVTSTTSSMISKANGDAKFLSREANKSFKMSSNVRVPTKIFKPASSGCSSSSSSLSSMTKSFSSKYPNGLPFEDEFYHYRNSKPMRNNRIASSVASDKSSSSLSNNSNNDGHDNNNDLRSSPFFPARQSSPYDDSDVMYVDFTMKSTVESLKSVTSKKTSIQPKLSAVKMTYYINDKSDNCFCEFESIKSTNGAFNKLIDGGSKHEQHGTFANAIDKRLNSNKDAVIYTALAW